MPTCPTCPGQAIPRHPQGWLAWQHDNDCPTRAAEDQTQASDRWLVTCGERGIERPATPTEVTLLRLLGYPAQDGEPTHATPSAGCVKREWKRLEAIASATP